MRETDACMSAGAWRAAGAFNLAAFDLSGVAGAPRMAG